MKWSVIALGVLGLFAALGAAVLLATLNVDQSAAEQAEDPEVFYLVASSDLPPMRIIEASDIRSMATTQSQLPEDVYQSAVSVIGKVLTVPMVQDQGFSVQNFATDGSGVHLASALTEGMRAMSVSLSSHAGLDGLLYPGSRVDVVATLQLPAAGAGKGDYVSTTLLEDVQVLAIEDVSIVGRHREEEASTMRRSSSRRMVTLLVDEQQAQVLQLAINHGTISLAMRNPLDNASLASNDSTLLSDLTEKFIKHGSVTLNSMDAGAPLVVEAAQPSRLTENAVTDSPDDVAAPTNDTVVSTNDKTMTGEPYAPAVEPGQWVIEIIRGRRIEKRTFDREPLKISEASPSK